jgi:hypothetical protein
VFKKYTILIMELKRMAKKARAFGIRFLRILLIIRSCSGLYLAVCLLSLVFPWGCMDG